MTIVPFVGRSSRTRYDHTFGDADDNSEVFRQVVRPLLDHVLDRAPGCAPRFATLLAFGQTGAGKTYTQK